jgi:hypothetical protein
VARMKSRPLITLTQNTPIWVAFGSLYASRVRASKTCS